MSTMTENGQKSLTKKPAETRVVHDDSAISYLMDTARFEHLFRIARTLANSTLTPKHLRGESVDETTANCFRVVNQAMRWKFDPFAVADETYVVAGKLGYQGKLVAAVVNARAGLRERLRPTYEGEGDKRCVTIHGTFRDEEAERIVELTVGQAKTANEMWKKDPDQKLFYSGVIKWARRHCPDVIMGVLTEDDIERMQIETTCETVNPAARVQASPLNRLVPRTVTADDESIDADRGVSPAVEDPPNGPIRLSDLALAIEAALHEPGLMPAANIAQKQQVVEALAEGKLTTAEARHLQRIVEENAARLSSTKGT